ncbi:MAG TPA: hypothetical protein VGF82_25540 [Terracidiphilus sp.]|jgi:hypothetical protein
MTKQQSILKEGVHAKARASIFDDSLDVDISDFAVKKLTDDKAPPRDQVRALAEAVNFRSREAPPAPINSPKKRAGRVYRTGRNVQFNIKASQETVDDFYALTEAHPGWVLGYTLERAIAALKRELETQS